ncbi:MAG: hypothetical protein LBD28_05355 [Tannerellaceae bacterium]|jgi:hypothetical protein|nr:hypothetical protein [Tannerellaceae bacterium]
MKIFKTWNVADAEKAVQAVNSVFESAELFDIATKAFTKEASLAAIDRIDKSWMGKIVLFYGRILKTSKKIEERNRSAEILLYIYNNKPTEIVRKKIQALNGAVIKYGSHYDTITRLNNRQLDYDYEDDTECRAEDSIHSDHTDHRLTPDICFHVKT